MPVNLSLPIMVVDDQREMLQLIRSQLATLGFRHIDESADPAAALERMRKTRYGLVISDLGMEPMDGLQFLGKIRAEPDLRPVPFIMISGVATMETITAAKALGIAAFIAKPFTTATLKSKLVGVLGPF